MINFRDGVHHGAERRYAQIVAYVQNDGCGDKIQPCYINYETLHRLTFVSQKARPSEKWMPRRKIKIFLFEMLCRPRAALLPLAPVRHILNGFAYGI